MSGGRGADVIVVGAGLVGAACAAALAGEGRRVVVVDPNPPGSGATAAGMGHVVVMDDSEAQFALTHYSRGLWDELEAGLPRAAEVLRSGTLWVAADEEEMGAVRSKQAFYGARGVEVSVLDERTLYEAEPELRAGFAGGLLVGGDSVVYAPWIARHLLGGAEWREARVTGLGEGEVRLADGGRLSGDEVVVAAGTWTAQLLPKLPVRPRKGHLAITDRYPGFLRHQLVELGYLKSAHSHSNESVAFNVQPRATGQILIGSSRQYNAATGGVEPRLLSRMLRRAVEYMPRLSVLEVIRTWTGLRAATPDSLPLIGKCPGYSRVWLATGHEGLGITTSLGTARLVADLMAGRTPAIDAGPYAPARFGTEFGG